MEKITLPQKINFIDGKEPNQGFIEIEPCFPGYGMTLGNALRRVMLSSLTGAAVVGMKISNVSHEFSTIPHIKEDILEIILNLKQFKLKVFDESDEELKLELKVHGKKEVKAGDITKDSKVEIVNPDLVLANITDMSGSLEMEIFIGKGRGYRPVEAIEDKKNEIGYVDIDSIFSPVLSTGIKVDNVRVGKMTNWDKLILDVLTDGTITAKEAFERANKILIEQFTSLTGEKKDEKESTIEEVKDEKVEIKEELKEAKKTKIKKEK
jgi:DNA-directed RNA polymerase subunit alpha